MSEHTPEQSEYLEEDPTGRFVRIDNKILGSGAFKTVYRAIDRDRGIEVAWNKLRPGIYQADFNRFLEEVKLLRQLDHPHIINFIHCWIDEDQASLVFITEYMTSGTLKQFLKVAKSVKLKVIKEWCLQILDGLHYLHTRDPPIIHRDIKCDNIFINGTTGEVKIGDLGLATVTKGTNALSVIGTPEFMAPEFYNEIYTTSVDIWAFGMAMIEMVTQQYPFSECANIAQIFKKVSSGELPTKQLDMIACDELREFIMKCLSAPDQRPTAESLLQDPFLLNQTDEISNKPTELRLEKGDKKLPSSDSQATDSNKQDPIRSFPVVPATMLHDQNPKNYESEGMFTIDTSSAAKDAEHPSELMEAPKAILVLDQFNVDTRELDLVLKVYSSASEKPTEIDFTYHLDKDDPNSVTDEMRGELEFPEEVAETIEMLLSQTVESVQNTVEAENPPVFVSMPSLDVSELPDGNANDQELLELLEDTPAREPGEEIRVGSDGVKRIGHSRSASGVDEDLEVRNLRLAHEAKMKKLEEEHKAELEKLKMKVKKNTDPNDALPDSRKRDIRSMMENMVNLFDNEAKGSSRAISTGRVPMSDSEQSGVLSENEQL